MTTHSPLPWKVVNEDNDEPELVVAADGTAVVLKPPYPKYTPNSHAQRIANARLIVAAVNGLAFCLTKEKL